MKVKILRNIKSLNTSIVLEAGVMYDVPFVKSHKQTKKQYGLTFRNTIKNDYGYELVFWTDNISRSSHYLAPEVDFVIIDAENKNKLQQSSLF